MGQTQRQPRILASDRELGRKVKNNDYVVRPIDKKDHYIKRCVAIAGDSLEIRNRQIYINGKAVENPENVQYAYLSKGIGSNVSKRQLKDWNIAQTEASYGGSPNDPSELFLNQEQYENLNSVSDKVSVQIYSPKPEPLALFPHDPKHFPDWSLDNYGPIWIPKAGVSIDISPQNIALYRRIIGVYEGNDLQIKGNQILINGQAATSYTFKQDYFWAMGDNRHNSEDSRAWGFVPHDHIVGKPLFIWFSTKNARIFDGIRFNRMFKSANVD
jgi:signal peptidase I